MEQVEAPGLQVPKSRGETVRRELLEADLLRTDLKVRREGDHLLLPLAEGVDAHPGGNVVRATFEPQATPPPPYQERVDLPADLKALLPTSFDVIGEVLVVKLPEELLPHRAEIGRALLESQKNVRTVALDRGVAGELRVRDLEVLAGDPSTQTEHREYGVRLRVDPATCYFSPRLATERIRVARAVREGERVVDLFAGVAPFALVIARHARPARVDAIDLNPVAIRYAQENVRLNRAEAIVHPAEADARAWARAHPGVADRVLTNIPHTAADFLDAVLTVMKPEGGVWHHHAILAPDAVDAHVAELSERAAPHGRTLALEASREVRTYSPQERHFALDVRVR